MKKRTFLLIASLFSISQSWAQIDTLQNLNEVIVNATRANAKTGMVFSNVTQKEIKRLNLGQELPYLLNQLPSVVISSDAGAGIGHTGLRIRGTDATRINVTLNGIPYNDSESQGVFWVNMPDFASSVQSIQVQRGVGTSTNGAGAFGATMNVNTLQLNREAFGEVNLSAGSFNTFKTNVLASTGLLNDRFVFDVRLSKMGSDGYVDRASADLNSYYFSGGYYFKNNMIRLNHFGGNQKTYQAWNGIPQALENKDMAGLDAYIERNGYDEAHKQELLERGRRYNYYNYKNETDNYAQSHWQLISSFQLSKNWRFNPTLFYTKGDGFYEQFKKNGKLVDYNLPPVLIGNETISKTDLIRRKYLDNHFYGAVWSLEYEKEGPFKTVIGGGYNQYDGDHFGEIIWARFASNGEINHRYYDNTSTKKDFNLYGKAFYNFAEKWDTYLDLQYRNVSFDMLGTGDILQNLNFANSWNFFNPKVGLTYSISDRSSAFFSYAKGTKEPNRTDFVDRAPNIPNPEKLHDFEAGYKLAGQKWASEINLYFMNYVDQLVLTGQINHVGEAIRMNVPKSYRAGIEMQIGGKIAEKLTLNANLALSRNKIKEFTHVVASSDGTPDEVNLLKNTDISFSPNIVSGASLTYHVSKTLDLTLLPKYVGKQYLDNTSSNDKKLNGYFVTDFNASFTPKAAKLKDLNLTLMVNNIFNKMYSSNGYTYSYIYGGKVTENFVFPQAGTNFLLGLRVRL